MSEDSSTSGILVTNAKKSRHYGHTDINIVTGTPMSSHYDESCQSYYVLEDPPMTYNRGAVKSGYSVSKIHTNLDPFCQAYFGAYFGPTVSHGL
jgi:hypothetical protein